MIIQNVTLRALGLAVACLACGACGKSSSASAPSAESPVNGAAVIGDKGKTAMAPLAPAGTEFDAQLDDPIDTRTSRPGEPFTVTLVEPIRASSGELLVPAGARIEGKIASIGEPGEARLLLDFETLKLQRGEVPIAVRVVSAQQARYATVPAPSGVASTPPGGNAAEPRAPGASEPLTPGAAQPQAPSTAPTTEVHILMQKGAVVRLALVRPIMGEPQATTPSGK